MFVYTLLIFGVCIAVIFCCCKYCLKPADSENSERERLNYSAFNNYANERRTFHFQDQSTSRRPFATYQNENEIFMRRPVRPIKQGRSLLNMAAIMKHIHPNCNTDKVFYSPHPRLR